MPRILVIDKTAGLDASHERHEAMAQQPDVEVHVLGPRHWIESGRAVEWRLRENASYTSHPGLVFGKDFYARAGYYSGLCRTIARSNPDMIQLLEEPWSITALQTLLAAAVFAPTAKILFYTWENIYRPWTYPSRASILYALIDKILHTRSTAAVCASQEAESVLRRKGFAKTTRVISYGIPEFFFEDAERPDPTNRPFTIGYAGRLMHIKGIDLLLHALSRMKDCRLILGGSGEDEERYRAQAESLGIANRIEWAGSMTERQVPHLLRRMDVFVLPSRSTPGWQEQLGRVTIEAMAVGTPVIGARSGAIPEAVGEAGLLFEENNAGDLIRHIEWLRDNPHERLRLSEAGRKRARAHFTWDRFASEICSFYRSL